MMCRNLNRCFFLIIITTLVLSMIPNAYANTVKFGDVYDNGEGNTTVTQNYFKDSNITNIMPQGDVIITPTVTTVPDSEARDNPNLVIGFATQIIIYLTALFGLVKVVLKIINKEKKSTKDKKMKREVQQDVKA